MPVYWLDDRHQFPDPQFADPSGLLAVGGDLSVNRLLLAYRQGIFPWYDETETPILWHAPHQRFVISKADFRYGRSIRKLVKRHQYVLTYDRDFNGVLSACSQVPRPNQTGTWLGAQMFEAYGRLYSVGYAHSAEAYTYAGDLVGGVYGVTIGRVFFGESMFSLEPGASKIIFAELAPQLFDLGYVLIDCQIHTEHLQRFGGQQMDAGRFRQALQAAVSDSLPVPWPQDVT